MNDELRPRRSVLYLPGANQRALEKAATLPADGLILDLEDAVAPDAKADARQAACAAAADGRFGPREVAIRANGLDTAWFADDVRAIVAAGPDVLLVPKVDSVEQVRTIEAAVEDAGADEDLSIWAMLETPRAVLDARELVHASPRLTGLVLGTNDLAKELHAEQVRGRAPLLTALSWCVLAAREAGLVVLDGVFNDLDDPEGLEAECRQGRELGFDGKTLIHPRQIEPCNRVFAPSDDEVAHAREVIEAFEAARAEGRGVVTVGGRMVENLHVEQARRTLAVAEVIAARG
ncbi:MAG: HpcH/HpaI aldolase/citrate lyase family protein [Nitriliruptoraceae bacterium]